MQPSHSAKEYRPPGCPLGGAQILGLNPLPQGQIQMYRVSTFIRHFAVCLGAGVIVATLWVSLDPASYYDFIEWRLADLPLPASLNLHPASLTPLSVVSDGLMAFFMFFVAKELWESLILERGALSGPRAIVPLGGMIGAALGAVAVWTLFGAIFETADEAGFATGWSVPVGSDVVLAYLMGRWVFGPGHPALHILLLVTVSLDVMGLVMLGVAHPTDGLLKLAWLALPLAAGAGVWLMFDRRLRPDAPERLRRRAMALWPYIIAGIFSYIGVAAAGLPPALGLLPVIPVIPHADRSFGLFAEAEEFLHDPLNRLAHALVRPLAVVLFLFGLTRGGIDLQAAGPTTGTVLAAFWLGKPLGFITGCLLAARLGGGRVPMGLSLRELGLIALLLGMGFTVPVLGLAASLPGGEMAEAARLGLALSLLAGPLALGLSRLR